MSIDSDRPTVEKYRANARGVIKIAGEELVVGREFREHTWVEAELRKKICVTLTPDKASQERLSELAALMDKNAADCDAKLYLAGRDFLFHITLLEVKREDGPIDSEIIEAISREVLENETIMAVANTPITLDYFFIDKFGNQILAATQIPEAVLRAREEIAKIGEKYGLRPLSLDNILHVTMARLTKVPPPEKRRSLYRNSEFRQSLRRSPVTIKGEITGQSAWDFANRPPA